MKLIQKNQAGFTLIELMIVVGIIGILASIAIPNFSKYQAKARQTEAKIGLAAIYTAEKSFYSEYSAFVDSLDAAGYAPEGQRRFYAIGFTSHTGTVTGYGGAYGNTSFALQNNPYSCTATGALGATLAADAQTFMANANGCIHNGSTTMDLWSMTDGKILSNATIGL